MTDPGQWLASISVTVSFSLPMSSIGSRYGSSGSNGWIHSSFTWGGGTEKCLFSQTDSNSGNDGELWVAFCWKLFIVSSTWLSGSHSVCIVRFFMFWRGIKISKCIKNTQMAGSVGATSKKIYTQIYRPHLPFIPLSQSITLYLKNWITSRGISKCLAQ